MKLRRKLLSAGFAFGATALTLTTSTFAWYTANNEVKVDSLTGATSATADSSSIYIAAAQSYASNDTYKANEPGASVDVISSYGREVTPVLVNSGATRVLAPTFYDATAKTYSTLGGVETSDTTKPIYAKDSTASAVYEYVLRFQKPNATAATDVYVSKFALTNSASAANSKQQALAYDTDPVLIEAGKKVGIASAGEYNVDLLHALKMTVSVTNLTSTGAYDSTATATSKVYDLDGFADDTKDVNITSAANAVGYYNAVLKTNIAKPEGYLSGATCVTSAATTDADSTTSKLFTIPSTGYVEVRFTFWLDGWDEFCYDVCQKQNFTVEMGFSTAADKSVLKEFTARTGKASA